MTRDCRDSISRQNLILVMSSGQQDFIWTHRCCDGCRHSQKSRRSCQACGTKAKSSSLRCCCCVVVVVESNGFEGTIKKWFLRYERQGTWHATTRTTYFEQHYFLRKKVCHHLDCKKADSINYWFLLTLNLKGQMVETIRKILDSFLRYIEHKYLWVLFLSYNRYLETAKWIFLGQNLVVKVSNSLCTVKHCVCEPFMRASNNPT